MAYSKFHLVSNDSKKLNKIVNSPEFYVLKVKYILLFFLYLPKILFDSTDMPPASMFITNNLKRKRIRNSLLFSSGPAYRVYKFIMKLKCQALYFHLDKHFSENSYESAYIWNGALFPQSLVSHLSKKYEIKMLYFENGHFPLTIQADTNGINYYSSLTQEQSFYRNLSFVDSELLPEDIGIRANKVKYSLKTSLPQKYLFVPFQVPSDMQILDLSPWIKDMTDFYNILYEATQHLSGITFVIKEHPSFRISIKNTVRKTPKIIFANGSETKELIKSAQAVVTINSTVGVEALLLEKKVLTLGEALYNIQDLVLHASNFEEFVDNLKKIDTWSFDEKLRVHFLKFLYNRYLIKGDYSNPSKKCLENIHGKLI
jgi:capsular polysaccharide export protein